MESIQYREKLAELSHDIWAHWMKYLFSKCNSIEGGSIIPSKLVKRWMKQINTKYSNLSEKEKDSDREQADKIIQLLERSNNG